MAFLFYLLSGIALLSALMVVLSKSPINSVIYLIVCFLAIAGHYILLNAQFLAVVHIIVYTGAIMVVFLFVIMLLNLNKTNEPHKSVLTKFMAVISGGMLFLVLIAAAKGVNEMIVANEFDANIGLVANLGKVLYTDYMIPFEASSVLFLSAMIGAVMLGKKDKK
ncbi:MAG: NADH-quinone oxidoreductase subunit J [Bacteroidia bacterium]|nr:NADH-quinone oxidoreductase subunit J [Bacteroidia bacterium]